MASGDLKIDLVKGAFSQMRISGITVQPSPADNTLAIDRAEDMAAEFSDRNVCIGWNFEDNPDANTPSGVERKYRFSFQCLLAMRMLSDFGKGQQPDATLARNASLGASYLSSATATPRQTQYTSRQAVGSGNSLRSFRYNRFYHPQPIAPNTCETIKMVVGDIVDLVEHFNAWLVSPEDIDTYTIESDTGLTIVSDSKANPNILYRIQAVGNNPTKANTLLQVKIIVTSTTGRIETRLIDFILIDLDDTP